MTKQKIDLKSDILPAISCGNIVIGSSFADCDFLANILWLKNINPDVDLQNSQGWTCKHLLSEDGRSVLETICYFKNDVIMLCFNSDNMLYFILLKNGYEGKVFGEVGIGSTLGDLKKHIKIEYDSGDEAYYPSENSDITGIAFYTGFSPSIITDDEKLFLGGGVDDVDNYEEIVMISIQDWRLMNHT